MGADSDLLPRAAAAIAVLIPRAEREAIVGDLLEDAADRRLRGLPLTLHLCGECATIAAGFTLHRARTACSTEPARELAFGVALDSGRLFRGVRIGSRVTWTPGRACCSSAPRRARSRWPPRSSSPRSSPPPACITDVPDVD
jgi:hypothetical protein